MTDQIKKKIEELRGSGLGYRKIAQELNLPVSTVSSYLTRKEAKSQRQHNTCRNCGKRLKQTSGHRQRIYCSERCRYLWNKVHPQEQKRKAYYETTCLNCGSEFTAYGNNHRKFCSWQCYQINKRGDKN